MIKSCFLAALFVTPFFGCSPHHRIIPGQDQTSMTLLLALPDAGHVSFAFSADNYRVHPTRKNQDGAWEISLPMQSEFKYFYIVDGLVFLPDCPYREMDDFGEQNCIYTQKSLQP